ncbi:hypothetical protein [Brevundimonas diminuta]|uniref:hypothetical protein n=1 Tax=Brevundimonas diminuta TaxID=293 RepID=UPI00320ADF68
MTTDTDVRGAGGALVWAGDNLHLVWAYVALAMFLLVLASLPLGVWSTPFNGVLKDGAQVGVEGVKEVGYLFALNWSLYSVAVLPFMAVFAVRVWVAMPETIQALSAAGMIRDAAFARVPGEAVLERWRKVHRGCFLLFFIIFICVMLFVMTDWWGVVAEPILYPATLTGVTLADPVREFDWSVASLYEGSTVSKYPLLAFSFVGYVLVAGIATAVAFATCLSGLFFVAFMCGVTANRRRGWTLAAMPAKEDDRGGFRIFSPFFTAFICLSFTVAVGCLLMVIQNAYLRDPTSPNVFAFMFQDGGRLAHIVETSSLTTILQDAADWLFEPAMKVAANPQTGVGILVYAFTALAAVAVSWGLLRSTARVAQAFSLEHSPALAAELGVTNRVARGRLRDMELWPIGWMRLNQLVILVLAMALALLSYRLILAPAGLVAFLGVNSVIKIFVRRRKAGR